MTRFALDRARLRRWGGRLAAFGLAQGGIQAIGMVAGLLAARLLSVEGYAQYALLVATATAITVVGDSGIGSQVVAIGGRHMPDASRLGGLLHTARLYRNVIAGALSVAVGPLLAWLLLQNGAGIATSLALTTITIGTVFITLNGSLYRALLQLMYEFGVMQRSGLASAVIRLIGVVALIPFAALSVFAPTVGNGVATGVQTIWLRFRTRRMLDLGDRTISPGDTAEMKRAVRRLLPLNLVVVAQSQGASFLLGALGATTALAGVTAVSRYGLIFGLLSTIVGQVLSPAFARSKGSTAEIGRRYAMVLLGVFAGASAIYLVAALARVPLLSLLGPQYSHLTAEFLIVNAGSVLGALAAGAGTMNLSRGWTGGSWIMAPATIVWFTAGYLLLDLSTETGAAIFMATGALPGLITAAFQAGSGIRRKEGVEPIEREPVHDTPAD
ncbi:lipopolysaccharide biosynthesis protein [Demequina mangrovi]|uniref:Membrane protein involved in the export of O-antigen and teichoic acid n=1 Tax=Demequina mangrovi TaxID=1043493 RepID=A0A1H6YVX6_9MICO|nr:oligosaccharide flippase family protein [Demequina mangrovi]SEJ40955.1 Membrane protein involved in the export of O-antigen and teichoic acid [Demequina mangrovi]